MKLNNKSLDFSGRNQTLFKRNKSNLASMKNLKNVVTQPATIEMQKFTTNNEGLHRSQAPPKSEMKKPIERPQFLQDEDQIDKVSVPSDLSEDVWGELPKY